MITERTALEIGFQIVLPRSKQMFVINVSTFELIHFERLLSLNIYGTLLLKIIEYASK